MFVNSTYRWKNQNHARTYKTERRDEGKEKTTTKKRTNLNWILFVSLRLQRCYLIDTVGFLQHPNPKRKRFLVWFFSFMIWIFDWWQLMFEKHNGSSFDGNYIIMQYNSIRRNKFIWLLTVGCRFDHNQQQKYEIFIYRFSGNPTDG